MARRNALEKLWSMCYLSSGGFLIYSGISIYNNNEKFYNDILMPVSRYLSPETSHSLALTLTKYKVFPRSTFVDPPVLRTTLLGKQLSNPIGIAAGFDKQGEAIDGLSKMGFGIVEIGSVTPLPQPGNPKPRVFRLLEDRAIINRYGFNSDGHEKVNQRLNGIARDSGVMLGVNLGKNKESDDPISDYVSGIKTFGHLADYVVINISSPNTPGLRSLQGREKLQTLLSALVTTRNSLSDKKPLLLVKLAPDLSPKERIEVAEILNKKECKVDGLVISNTTLQRPNLLNKTHTDEAGGLSGQPLKDMATELIRDMYNLTKGKIPIIGVGGVFTGLDAYEKILAGASAIQIYSAFIYNGPPVIAKIKSELSEHLERHGFKSVDEAVGKENVV